MNWRTAAISTWILLGALVVAVVLTSALRHPPQANTGKQIHAAMRVARTYWNFREPVTISRARLPPKMSALASAEEGPQGTVNVITVTTSTSYSWLTLCATIVHEVGHLHQFQAKGRMWHTRTGVMKAWNARPPPACHR